MSDLFDGVLPFVHTARALSFRQAADELGVSPTAISKAVKRLEERLGVQLLHRTTRRVALSDEGTLFLARCEDAIAHLRAGRESVAAAQKAPRGELRVAASFVLGTLLTRVLPRFLIRYPELQVELRFSDRHSRLVDEHIDVALRVGELADSSLIARRLATTRWVTVASPEYLAREGTPGALADLAHHRCLCFRSPRGKAHPWAFEGAARFEVDGPLVLDQGELLVTAALGGAGVTQVFDFMAREHLASGRLVEVLEHEATDGPPIHALALPGRRRSAKVRAFLDFVPRLWS